MTGDYSSVAGSDICEFEHTHSSQHLISPSFSIAMNRLYHDIYQTLDIPNLFVRR
jgi:hypothetical protein